MTTLASPTSASSGVESSGPSAFAALWRRPVTAVCLLVAGVYLLLAGLSCVPQQIGSYTLPFRTLETRADEALEPMTDAAGVEHAEYAPPSLAEFPARIFGTDIQNRSVFYRTLYGTRTAMLITFCTATLAICIGVTLGIIAGYFGGLIDEVVTWLIATVSAVPWILLVLALTLVLKNITFGEDSSGNPRTIPPVVTVILALGLTDWVGICRLIRAEVLKIRSLDYVSAGKALGLSEPRILFLHILPNTLHLVIVTFTLSAVAYVQAEVALTFLGIGISDKPSWGRMIDDAKLELLRGVWWQFAAATLAIGILCLALSLLGDALRDALDPRTRSRR